VTLRTYQDFLEEFPAPHLVLARFRDVSTLTSESVVGGLLDALMLSGDYAMASVQDGPAFVLQCLFENGADATRFAVTVRATPFDVYAGLSSQRIFELNSVTRNAIAGALAQLRKRQ
jgi:hypothetical protein